jgi:GTP cyclohydrolase II
MMDIDEPLSRIVRRDQEHDCEGYGPAKVCVRVISYAELPTRVGRFRIVAFWNNRDAKEHVAMVHGDVVGATSVPTRLHSECLTGDVMGSLRCDCRDRRVAGWVTSGLVAAMLVFSASFKFRDLPGKAEAFDHIGYAFHTKLFPLHLPVVPSGACPSRPTAWNATAHSFGRRPLNSDH